LCPATMCVLVYYFPPPSFYSFQRGICRLNYCAVGFLVLDMADPIPF
jgi:hypothetical protein